VRLKCEGTREKTKLRLSGKRTSQFKSAGASVQSTTVSRGVRISVSNAGYTTFRGSVRVLATHSIRQFPLHFPSRASPCAIRFQTNSTLSFSTFPMSVVHMHEDTLCLFGCLSRMGILVTMHLSSCLVLMFRRILNTGTCVWSTASDSDDFYKFSQFRNHR